METYLAFETEIPIPATNEILYRRVYVLEQWLRRILIASLMSRYATHWRNAIPTEIAKEFKGRRAALRRRVVLDVESSDNDVWLLTLEELRRLLLSEFLWPEVRPLTGWQKKELGARVEQLREIRNVVGHNRATTSGTLEIFEGVEHYLARGIRTFRQQTLYRDPPHGLDVNGSSEEAVLEQVKALWDGTTRQVFLIVTEKFYSVIFLPVPPFTFISIADLLESFDHARHSILAFYVNDEANEFSVVWPRGATAEETASVLRGFEQYSHFTRTSYEQQDPKYVCDPRIWFYADRFAYELERDDSGH